MRLVFLWMLLTLFIEALTWNTERLAFTGKPIVAELSHMEKPNPKIVAGLYLTDKVVSLASSIL